MTLCSCAPSATLSTSAVFASHNNTGRLAHFRSTTTKITGRTYNSKVRSVVPLINQRTLRKGVSVARASATDVGGGGGGGIKPPLINTGGNGGEGEEGGGGKAEEIAEFFVRFFNYFAATLMVFKGLEAVYCCTRYAIEDGFGKPSDGRWYNRARIILGRGVVLSLEFLLISDILETIMFGSDVNRLISIAVTACVRTLIDYFTSKEIEEAEESLEKLEHKKEEAKAKGKK